MNGFMALMRSMVRSWCSAVVLCACLWQSVYAAPARVPSGALSAEVAEMYGRTNGLCAVIGVDSVEAAQLVADLALPGEMLVHGIALDDDSLRQARDVVSSLAVDGFATIEKLPLEPLPYRRDLVNLMVVPDLAAASAAGFTTGEALRALAPLGKLCIRSQGTWTVTDKAVSPGMDEWTHNVHGPDGNRASRDSVVGFPVGYRWHAGLPFNINNRVRQANRYAATRGLAVTGGRCFTLTDSEVDNLRGAYFLGQDLDQYVTARDAFNGMFLWRKNLGRVYYGGLWYANLAPFAAVGDSVYTADDRGKLVVLDAAAGTEIRAIGTTYAPGDLLVDRGTIAVATWKGGTWVGESRVNRYERRRMHSAIAEGTVEAYDVDSGTRLWRREELATSIRSADAVLFIARREGPDLLEESRRYKTQEEKEKEKAIPADQKVTYKRSGQAIVAVDLRTGKQLWNVTAEQLSPEGFGQEHLRLDAAGLGVVTVVHCEDLRSGKVSVLSAQTGECLVQVNTGTFPLLVDGAVHLGGKRYSPATGQELGTSSCTIGTTVCTPSYVVGNIIVRNRGGAFLVDGKSVVYGGARGACGVASVPAYGAFYTPQNWCTCCPPQISGFICFGPVRGVPTSDEMMANASVVKGPAFGTNAPEGAAEGELEPEWPMLRHGAARSSAVPSPAPGKLEVKWQTKVPSPKLAGLVALNWREYLNPSLTAPTAACGVVTTAVMDANQVVGIDLNDGKELWRFTLGARVDSSPTIYQGVCLFGAHDGFVYALDCKSGQLRWKMRMAPNDERMVSYGKVESPWPVVGSVLVADGVAYASAGRTQGSDGGIVIRAFSPFTGEVVWAKVLEPSNNVRELRRNDLLLKIDDSLQLMIARLDAKTGEVQTNPTREVNLYHGQLGSLKRSIAMFTKQIAAAPGDSAQLQKRLENTEKQLAELKEPESETAAHLGQYGRGSEGYINWNWPKLGYRKFPRMNYGNISGTLVSWDANLVCAMTNDRRITAYAMEKVGKAREKLAGPADWTISLPERYQVTSLVVCTNAIVAGGGIYGEGDNAKESGFVTVLSRDQGETLVEHAFDAPVVYNGVAVLDKKVCAALTDSSVCLLGEE